MSSIHKPSPLRALLGIITVVLSFSVQAELLTLRQVLSAVQETHPEIKVLEARLEALEAKRAASTNIPAPMVAVSYMGANGPFRSGSMSEKPSFGITQTIPFPSKIISTKRFSSREYEAGVESKNFEQNAILASAKSAYWNYYQAFYEQKLKKEQVEILRDHLRRISRSPVSDSLANSHILSIQNEISVMSIEIDQSDLDLLRARNVMEVFTGLPAESLSLAPEELSPTAFTDSPVQESDSVSLRKAHADVEATKAGLSVAQSAYLPDITIQYKWNSEFATTPKNQEFMIGVDLPFLLFWQPKAGVSEARARVIESEAMEVRARRELAATQENILAEIHILRNQLDRFDSEIIPRTEKRITLSHSISFSDMQSLDEHRAVLEDALKFKLQRIALRADFEKKVAEFEALKGGVKQ